MTDDAARRAILARRTRFIAAALTGAGISLGACRDASPEVCLSPLPPTEKTKGGADAGTSPTGPTDAGGGFDAPPVPCLSPAVCLKPAWPRDAGKP
ncbi:MAG: hypothetical protein ABI175_24915 [Polyangiales bacterium]